MRCWSWSLALLLLSGCGNAPPEPPLLLGQTRLRPGDTLRLTVWAVDPDGDSLSYRVDWGDGRETDWSRRYPSGERVGFAQAYGDTGAFEIFARARDLSSESGASDPFFVRVRNYGPGRPGIPRLADSADTIAVGHPVGARVSADHPLGERVALQFDWGDTLGGWSEYVRAGEWVLERHTYSEPGTWEIRARARDTTDRLSSWSDPATVVVVDTVLCR